MFNFFKKNPVKELETQYLRHMEEAMQLQRKGDLKAYAAKIEEAEAIQKKIDESQLTRVSS